MKFIFQFFLHNAADGEPTPFLAPIHAIFPSIESARAAIGKLASHPTRPLHSVLITSDAGDATERWMPGGTGWERSNLA